MLTPIALGMPGGAEWIVIALIGLLLFGKRLPEVGRSLGKGIVEFKKGLHGVENEIATSVDDTPKAKPLFDPNPGKPLNNLPSDHKFDPYTGKPIESHVEGTV